MSGNFEIGQRNLEICEKSGKFRKIDSGQGNMSFCLISGLLNVHGHVS